MSHFSNINLKYLFQVAKALGKVHACSINKEATSPDFSKDIYGEFAATMPKEVQSRAKRFELYFCCKSERDAKKSARHGLITMFQVYCSAFKPLVQFDSSPRMVKAIEDIEKILPDYYGSNLPSTIHKQLKYRPVLVNGGGHCSSLNPRK